MHAAAGAPLNCRNTMAAATTSVTPMPIREMTAGRDSPGASCGSGAAAAGADADAATRLPGRPTD
ncbi:MAG TPA: hypothetical protein VNT54_12310 [Solirubrobacteraceae bacterium]|nr:hypothetical protein [Solirubrobacteraceae bacterium]